MFLIVKEESVQSGVRRVYALTGHKAFAYVQAARSGIDWLGAHYKRPLPNPAGLNLPQLSNFAPLASEWLSEVSGKLEDTEKKFKEAHKAAIEARRELSMAGLAGKLVDSISELGGFKTLLIALELDNRADVKYIVERYAGTQWPDDYVVFVAANIGGKAALACKVSQSALDKGLNASELIKLGAGICQGGGGGRPDFAEAGGKEGSKVGEAVDAVKAKVAEILGG